MRELAEHTWVNTDKEEPTTVKEQVWILHFGVRSEIMDDGDGRIIGVTNTVAVCQNVKTGELNCFPPESLKIIGTELKK